MAVQVDYPGVYIEEFAPGAPIQGVGTSTAGFIGTTHHGPIERPRLVQSWDDFAREFDDFKSFSPTSGYLVPAVYGFFQNGGKSAYIVRASSGKQASVPLDSRGGANPVLVARAVEEGIGGNAIVVTVKDTSVLAKALTDILAARTIATVNGARTDLTLDPPGNQSLSVGDAILITQGATQHITTISGRTAGNGITLAIALPAAPNFVGGTVRFAPHVAAHRDEQTITGITVNGNGTVSVAMATSAGFATDDTVELTDNAAANPVRRGVIRTEAGNTIIVSDFPNAATYNGGEARSADFAIGQKALRLASPTALGLSGALPAGTVIAITLTPAAGPVVTEIGTIESAGGDVIRLRDGLTKAYSVADPRHLPVVTSLEFSLEVNDPALVTQEDPYTGLSMSPNHPGYWRTAVTSRRITLEEPTAAPSPSNDPRPVAKVYPLVGGVPDNRPASWAAVHAAPEKYLALLEPVDAVALVAIPGATDANVQQAIIKHCEDMADRFGVLDSVRGADSQAVETQFAGVRTERGYVALYYPWIEVRTPAGGGVELWPPSGHVLGAYARTDSQRGVHKAPANLQLRATTGVERALTDTQHGPLNLLGINVIRVFPEQTRPTLWGARTSATDRNWQYVNVRRLFLYLEESIEEGIRWAVFEPNNLALWAKLKRSISAFLTQAWRDGALFGETAEQAFYVRIDEALNPFSTQALGRLYIEIGVRPTYPAEFIIVRIGIWQGGSEVAEP